MKMLVKLSIIVLISIGLSACASFSSLTKKSDTAYLKAKAAPNLRIPAGLSSSKVGDNFSVPFRSGHGPVPVATTPPGGVYKAQVPGTPKESKQGRFLKPLFK